MSRAHNFSAGPAALPVEVLEELQPALVEFGDMRAGIMEISHRSAAFAEVHHAARDRLRRLMSVPDDYTILFLQGGASLQFWMLALNLVGDGGSADYLLTGTWSRKARTEAARVGDIAIAWDDPDGRYDRVPADDEFTVRPDARYLHYTSNNTIAGTQFSTPPAADRPLVCDMSSDICSRPVDVGAHALIYAGAQKNLGPSGVTAVILSPWVLEQSRRCAAVLPGGLPSMLDYGLMASKDSLFNTPNTFGIFALERVLAWLERQGGLEAMAARNARKAATLYAELDRTDFWRPHARVDSRSQMNVTWRLPTPELEATFVAEAADAGLMALKGHRSVGGIRASIYNATGQQAVDDLVAFMRDFEARHG
ncbi:MAG: 3-phosphoserine/phosphohydroxythreonine transaminase [Deltaproteobacteria bacterium]|nr:MAG: 3-phosphoserine/phosphohydroxythreonine transaminase [Deltaproteobacteria bacterium]